MPRTAIDQRTRFNGFICSFVLKFVRSFPFFNCFVFVVCFSFKYFSSTYGSKALNLLSNEHLCEFVVSYDNQSSFLCCCFFLLRVWYRNTGHFIGFFSQPRLWHMPSSKSVPSTPVKPYDISEVRFSSHMYSFSYPEPTILLTCGRDRGLRLDPIF